MEGWEKRLLFPSETLTTLRASKWLFPPSTKPLCRAVPYSLFWLAFSGPIVCVVLFLFFSTTDRVSL